MRLFAKLLVLCFVVWLIIVVINGLFGISIQFPFEIIEEGEFPYHRMQTLRIALF